MSLQPRLSRFFRAAARPTPPRRLRAMYWTVSACALALLAMLHVSLATEHRLESELAAATRAELSAPRVIVVRMPPAMRAAATKVKPNSHRGRAAHKE